MESVGDSADYSVQPPPSPAPEGAVSVHDLVLRDLEALFPRAVGLTKALDAMADRKAFGLKKYGEILHTENGRDYVRDVDDELCDLAVYLRALVERHPDLKPIFAEDYEAVLRLLIRWRSVVPMLQQLEG